MKKNTMLSSIPQVISCVLFGLSYMTVKLGVSGVSTFTLLAWRFLFSFIALSICVLLRIAKLNLRGKNLRPLFAIAVFQPLLYFFSATYGISLTTVSESGTIAACMPIVSIVLSAVILREKPSKLQCIGIGLSVTGVIIVGFVKGQSPSFSIIGYVLLLIAMISDASHIVFVRKAAEFSSFEKTYVMSLIGTLVFVFCALVEHLAGGTLKDFVMLPFRDGEFLIRVLYLGIGCQVFAFHLSNYACARLGVAKASSFSGIVTLVSVMTGVFLLGDDFTAIQGIGTAMVIIGIYISNSGKSVRAKNEIQ